jgi:hypothetical protein
MSSSGAAEVLISGTFSGCPAGRDARHDFEGRQPSNRATDDHTGKRLRTNKCQSQVAVQHHARSLDAL